jgi:hypothetical protein
MLSAEGKMNTQYILTELLQCENNTQQFSFCYGVLFFAIIKSPRGIGYDAFLSINDLTRIAPRPEPDASQSTTLGRVGSKVVKIGDVVRRIFKVLNTRSSSAVHTKRVRFFSSSYCGAAIIEN